MDTRTPGAPPFTFTTPPRIVVEWGAATNGRLATEAARLGKRPLIVASSSLAANGALQPVLEALGGVGLAVQVHTGVPPEPDLIALQRCIDAVADSGADSVIAIGGGSVLDVAKAAAALMGTGHPAQAYFDGNATVPEQSRLPILTVPTTAGTGSEVTWVGVFTDKAAKRKASIRGGSMMPAVAVLDAALTLTCPRTVTIHSGMDAFVQALEAYTSNGANPLTDSLAREAATLTSYHTLATLDRTPGDRPAREAMALGGLMAGLALNTARLGLVHGLAHPVGALTGAAHGLVCALLLLPVMRYNAEAAADKYAQLARDLMGSEVATLPDRTAAAALMDVLQLHLRDIMELPERLRDIGLTRSALERVADESLVSGSTKANPRPVSRDDALAVLEDCY